MNSLIDSTDDVSKAMDTDRLLREKELQNQLIDAERRIYYLKQEQQNIQNMLTKSETAYSTKNYNLLQLINAHTDKINILKQQFRNAQHELHIKQRELFHTEKVITGFKCCIRHIRELNNKNLDSKEKLQRKICNLNLKIITNSRRSQDTLQNLQAEIVSTKQKLLNAKKQNRSHNKSVKNREEELLTQDLLKNCNLTGESTNEDSDVATQQPSKKRSIFHNKNYDKNLLDSVLAKNKQHNLKILKLKKILKNENEHSGPLKINQYFNNY